MWCMTTARLFVLVGAPLRSSGSVVLAPSPTYSIGTWPPSATAGLRSTKADFAALGNATPVAETDLAAADAAKTKSVFGTSGIGMARE
jgi:hypothetical protein